MSARALRRVISDAYRDGEDLHLPGGDDKLLAFGAGVGIDEVRTHQENDYC
jgi:hypothetical protein